MKIFIPAERARTAADVDSTISALAAILEEAGSAARVASATLFELTSFAGDVVAPAVKAPHYGDLLTVSLCGNSTLEHGMVERSCERVGLTGAHPCEEHVHMSTAIANSPTTIVRFGFLTRRADLSRGEFHRHWLTRHSPLVMAHEPLFYRYAANLPLTNGSWDGIVEQWFVDEPTWIEHDRRILESRPDVFADIPRFLSGMMQYAAKPTYCRSFGKDAC